LSLLTKTNDRRRFAILHHNVIQKLARTVPFFISFLMSASQNESGNVARPKPILSREAIKALANIDVLGVTGDDEIVNAIRDAQAETKPWSNLWNKSDIVCVEIDLSGASFMNVLPANSGPEWQKGVLDIEEKVTISPIPDTKEVVLGDDWKSVILAPAPGDEALNALATDDEADEDL
jgi:hypothetical protein